MRLYWRPIKSEGTEINGSFTSLSVNIKVIEVEIEKKISGTVGHTGVR